MSPTICTQCRWMRHDSRGERHESGRVCAAPDKFPHICYVDGRLDLPLCRVVNQHGKCPWFKTAGRVRLLFRNHAFVVCLMAAMIVGSVFGILSNIPEPELGF